MIIIGITGNLASGKSETARLFKKHGAVVFDADAAAKRAVKKGTPVYKAIVKIFGEEYLRPNKDLDRKKLARRVFSRPKDLKTLNTLIHPGVIFEVFNVIHRLKGRKGVLALDVPLLFESRMESLADFTLVVRSTRKRMLERAGKKGLSGPLARKILSTQWPIAKKARLADFVIDNNGTPADLEKKVLEVLEKVQSAGRPTGG